MAPIPSEKNKFLEKLREITVENLSDEKFGVAELARIMGMSHSNLHRKLRSATNQTINQFIRETRLEKSKELLLNEDFTIAEISYRVGFGSPTYFNKCFHEHFGYSPGDYKNKEFSKISAGSDDHSKAKKSRNRRILVIGLLAIISFTAYMAIKIQVLKAGAVKDKSIAILPFKYLSDETEKQYIADGLLDGILLHLQKIYDLRVVSRTSVEQYRNTEKTAITIGQELDVAYLVEGSYMKEGDQFNLILQLIRTRDDRHVWSHEYDGNKEPAYEIEIKAAEDIAGELKAEITPEEQQSIRRVPTHSLTAYDFYQKACEYNYDEPTRETLGKARILYYKALKCDSTFALAYVGLANNYWGLHQFDNWDKPNYKDYLDSVSFLVNRALAYDGKCAEAYTIRGRIYMEFGKTDLAMKDFDRAIKYNPNDPWAYDYKAGWGGIAAISTLHEMVNRFHGNVRFIWRLGQQYLWAGFPEKAKEYFDLIYELEQDSASYSYFMAQYENARGNKEAAYQYAKKAWARDTVPNVEFLNYCLVAGRYKEAYPTASEFAERLKKYGPLSTDIYNLHSMIGACFWQVGDTAEAKYFYNQAIIHHLELINLGRYEKGSGIYLDLARCYAFLGDKEKTYQYLDAFNTGPSHPAWDVDNLKEEILFNSIRGEPRFQAILKQVEAPYLVEKDAAHEKVRKWMESQDLL